MEKNAKQIFLELGGKKEVFEDKWPILVQSQSLEDLRQQIRKNHFQCDIEQFLLPIFRPLYQAEVKERVDRELIQVGFKECSPKVYLTQMGNQPYVYLISEYGISVEQRDRLRGAAQEVMFKIVKECLEIR